MRRSYLMRKHAKEIIAGAIVGVLTVAVAVIALGAMGANARHSGTRALALANADRFAALADWSLPRPSAGVLAQFAAIHPGAEKNARTAAPGLYIASWQGAPCAVVAGGAAGCTTSLDQGVWLMGDMIRAYDSRTAPFNTQVYGLAEDGVARIDISLGARTVTAPVHNNVFRSNLHNSSFSDITGVSVIHRDGTHSPLDASKYFAAPTAVAK
jgi:hypothetical protein